MSKLEKILLTANIILYGFLAIFSYAYVDLNLTLSQNPQFLLFVRLMQQLGYYHRPQATLIYLMLIIFAFSFFIFHLINTYLIWKILNRVNIKTATFGTAFYALNPLFLIEGVANAHNDIVVATLMLASVYFIAVGKSLWAYLLLFSGTLVKYIPILNLPWLMWATISKKKKSIDQLILLNLVTMAVFTYLYSSFKITVPFVSSGATQIQFQPWYLFWTLPFVALLPSFSLIILSIGLSIGASLRYLPYLFYGDWSQPMTISFMQSMLLISLMIALLFIVFINLLKPFSTKK